MSEYAAAHDDLESRWRLQQNTVTGKWRVMDDFWGTASSMEYSSRRAAEREIERRRRNKIQGMRGNAEARTVADKWTDA
jgi:hypothetical protein